METKPSTGSYIIFFACLVGGMIDIEGHKALLGFAVCILVLVVCFSIAYFVNRPSKRKH